MDKESWKRVLSTYASYGVNCMRFHSWCPPEAAFAAADEMGMMMEPELSHWNCQDAFEDTKAQAYYRLELTSILRTLANHPSFVMLTFGNELWATKRGHEVMDELLKIAHSTDATRLYANSPMPIMENLVWMRPVIFILLQAFMRKCCVLPVLRWWGI